jgi:hypothetical protein
VIIIKDNMFFLLFEEFFSCFPDDADKILETKLEIINSSVINYNRIKFLTILYNYVNKLMYKITYFSKSNINKKTILFQNNRTLYRSIIKDGSSSFNLVVLGENLLSFYYFIISSILVTNTIYFPIYPVYNSIYVGILEKNEIKLSESIRLLTRNIKKLNPDLIVLQEDGNIEGRALTLAAKKLKIPTITIQDGIFSSSNKLLYGYYSDYMFVWGQYFKDMYLDQNIKDHEHIKILGYPNKLTEFDVNHRNKKTVYYIGQDYEHYNKDYLEYKINTIQNLKLVCDKLGFNFYYRPHQNENRNYIKSKVKNIQFSRKSDSLMDSIEKGDIFISFNSTALIEANLHTKIGIQLKNFNIKTDDFETIGACSKTCQNFEELECYLKEIAESKDFSNYFKPVDPNYIEITPDPGVRFLELVKELI